MQYLFLLLICHVHHSILHSIPAVHPEPWCPTLDSVNLNSRFSLYVLLMKCQDYTCCRIPCVGTTHRVAYVNSVYCLGWGVGMGLSGCSVCVVLCFTLYLEEGMWRFRFLMSLAFLHCRLKFTSVQYKRMVRAWWVTDKHSSNTFYQFH